jgi:hypothetical protein
MGQAGNQATAESNAVKSRDTAEKIPRAMASRLNQLVRQPKPIRQA